GGAHAARRRPRAGRLAQVADARGPGLAVVRVRLAKGNQAAVAGRAVGAEIARLPRAAGLAHIRRLPALAHVRALAHVTLHTALAHVRGLPHAAGLAHVRPLRCDLSHARGLPDFALGGHLGDPSRLTHARAFG